MNEHGHSTSLFVSSNAKLNFNISKAVYPLLVTYFPGGSKILVTGSWSLVTGHWSLVTGRWSLVAGHWSLVTGHWSLVAGRWSLVTGHWSLVTDRLVTVMFVRSAEI